MSDYPHTPGSDAAVADGCICPVMDNAHGKGCGYTTEDGERLIAVFEDRDRVVAMWRDAGVPCFQVAPGDF